MTARAARGQRLYRAFHRAGFGNIAHGHLRLGNGIRLQRCGKSHASDGASRHFHEVTSIARHNSLLA